MTRRRVAGVARGAWLWLPLLVAAGLPAPGAGAQELTVRAARLIDGAGRVVEDATVRVVDGRIAGFAAVEGTPVVDLRDVTLLPGFIDTHVHLTSHFDARGRLATDASGETPGQAALAAAGNAWRTLQAGFTTVQSMGAREDVAIRDAVARGVLPGPTILTSIRPVTARTGGPEEIREAVAALADEGADLIKIFASASLRDDGYPTLSQPQLDAACGEARRRGLRTAVHAHGPESVRRAVRAGCHTIEHGALLDRETLELLAEEGVWFDPNIHLVSVNYLENQDRYLGIGNYSERGFELTRASIPVKLEMFRTALEVPGLKIAFGTDAVAGAHGRQAAELVYRVEEAGQPAPEALRTLTLGAAESLGLAGEIGSVEAGKRADLVAVAGNPLDDIRALERVVFVMKAGVVIRRGPGAP